MHDSHPNLNDSNIEELLQELEVLRQENSVLQGLMMGGYAYFLRQFMVGHLTSNGLAASICEETILDALQRILSTQNRFGYEYLSEIEAVLQKMTQTVPLDPYLRKAAETLKDSHE
jgi:hypothetical protein